MIKSMTGFGKRVFQLSNMQVAIEIKTLNSKQLDLSVKVPSILKEQENIFRSLAANAIKRGKCDLTITHEFIQNHSSAQLNAEYIKQQYNNIKLLATELGDMSGNFLEIVMQMPEIYKQSSVEISENDIDIICENIQEALSEVNKFRINEGIHLQKDIEKRIYIISKLLGNIEPYEKNRILNLKSKLRNSFAEMQQKETLNENRFEQELIYYIEKLDISEEKTRLAQHCSYFIETLNEADSNGKKLSFIVQEIGREINTIGAKASDFNIQQIIVTMKDELEKIKEQLFNVL